MHVIVPLGKYLTFLSPCWYVDMQNNCNVMRIFMGRSQQIWNGYPHNIPPHFVSSNMKLTEPKCQEQLFAKRAFECHEPFAFHYNFINKTIHQIHRLSLAWKSFFLYLQCCWKIHLQSIIQKENKVHHYQAFPGII